MLFLVLAALKTTIELVEEYEDERSDEYFQKLKRLLKFEQEDEGGNIV